MSIVNSVKTTSPGRGVPGEYVSLLTQSLVRNASTAFTLTGFVNYVRSGWVRIKSITAVAAAGLSGIKITGTDGTTTVTLYQDGTTRTVNELLDLVIPIISDLNLTTITVTVTMINAGASDPTCDFEVCGNS